MSDLCECGCGQPVKPGKRFVAGFHAIRKHRTAQPAAATPPASPLEAVLAPLYAANRLQHGTPRETMQFAYHDSLIRIQAGVPITADNQLYQHMVANKLPVDWVNTASEVSP
jgi:hypothetical protein